MDLWSVLQKVNDVSWGRTRGPSYDPFMTDQLIVEGLVLTAGEDGSPHLAPMGPIVNRAQTEFTLRPFCTSQTFANLQRTGVAVFHLTDDVELLAAAAIGRVVTPPAYDPIDLAPGF